MTSLLRRTRKIRGKAVENAQSANGLARRPRFGPRAALALLALATAGGNITMSSAQAGEWRPGMRAARAYAHGRQGSIRFAVVGENGKLYDHRGRGVVPAASVFKAMLLVTYLRQPSVRDRALRSRDKALLGPMIKRSDNDAASRVRDIVGHRRIRRLARRAHMRHFKIARPWGLSKINANEQARFFFRIERYIPRRHERYARYLLSHIVPSQRWGVARYVDRNKPRWRIFFKGGWGSGTGWACHQVAFLERGDRRIALAVLTRNSPSHRYATRTLRGIARRLLRKL